MDTDLGAFFARWQETWERIDKGVKEDLRLLAQEPGMHRSITLIRLERRLTEILERMRLQIGVTEQLMNDLVKAHRDGDSTGAH